MYVGVDVAGAVPISQREKGRGRSQRILATVYTIQSLRTRVPTDLNTDSWTNNINEWTE